MVDPDTEFTWQTAAQVGSLNDLHRWAAENHHVDLTNRETVLSLAANAVANGAWRNNSGIEDIHAGAYKRPGQKAPRGLSDAEMMVGNIETAKTVRGHLASGGQWWTYDVENDWFAYDRAYAGTPLTEHVTKKVLTAHTKQVKKNLWLFRLVQDLVGRDRFLAGLALAALSDAHWGTPLWDAQVDAWAEESDPTPAPTLVQQMKTDPTVLPLADLEAAIGTGLGYAPGRERWHQHHCGNPNHSLDGDLAQFLGTLHSIMGMPMIWAAAAIQKKRQERGVDL